MDAIPDKTVDMDRTGLNAVVLEEKYEFKTAQSENLLRNTKNYVRKNYKPSPDCMRQYLYKRIPFIKWIQTYDVRTLFLNDLIGGLTVGVINIPQGMAYSLAAGLPPIYGLYVSFFTSMVYMFLGSSRNISIGTYGIVSLMVEAVLQAQSGVLYPVHDALGPNDTVPAGFISTDPTQGRVLLATVLSLLTGIIHIILGILHAGVASKYLSDVVVAAFTTGAAYHIVVSQINNLLGVKLAHNDSIFSLVANLIEIFRVISNTNIASLVISLVAMVCLYLVKHFINHKYQHKLIAPVPIELAVIVFGTLFSYLWDFNGRWKVPIVGPIPLGFPTPVVPPPSIYTMFIGDAISIAVVSFAINLSMAKLYAKKYNYSLRPNQELFSYGVGNILSSFFLGFPSCVGLSRTVILVGTNSRTQLHAIYANIILAIVIAAIGFLFSTLPTCCLASIIVIALLNMMFEVRQIVPIFKRSKLEALAWLATFAGVMILDISYGLYIGLAVSILLVIIQSQRATTTVLGNIPKTDIYEDVNVTKNAREIEGIKIIRYEASLYYANAENFAYKIQKLSAIKPDEVIESLKRLEDQLAKQKKKIQSKRDKAEKKQKKAANSNGGSTFLEELETEERKLTGAFESAVARIHSSIIIRDIVLDCSSMNQIDSMGIETLEKLNSAYKEIGVTLRLSHCKSSLFRIFEKLGFKSKFDYSLIYPATHDAVVYILKVKKNNELSMPPSMSPIHDALAAADDSRPEVDRTFSTSGALGGQLTSSVAVNIDVIEPAYVVDSEKAEYNAFREITSSDIMKP